MDVMMTKLHKYVNVAIDFSLVKTKYINRPNRIYNKTLRAAPPLDLSAKQNPQLEKYKETI